MNRREFMQSSLTLAAIPLGTVSHHHIAEALDQPGSGSQAPPTEPVISGTGQFRYQYTPEKLRLPSEVRMKHGHGLCHDQQGRIYFTFEPEQVDETTRCLVRFEPDGTGAVLLGTDNALAHGVPHGLNIHVDKAGKAVLYHTNNEATVHKTTLEGQVLWTQKWTAQMGN